MCFSQQRPILGRLYSDHVPVAAKFKLKVKKARAKSKDIKLDLALLNPTIREKYLVTVYNKFEVLGEAEEVDEQKLRFKVAVTEAAMEQITRVRKKTKQKCITEDILVLMKKKGEREKSNNEKYETLLKKF